MAKNQKNQGFAAIRDVVSSSRFRESRVEGYQDMIHAVEAVSPVPIEMAEIAGESKVLTWWEKG